MFSWVARLLKKSVPPKTYVGIKCAPVSIDSLIKPLRSLKTIAFLPGVLTNISAIPPGSIKRCFGLLPHALAAGEIPFY